MPIIAVDPAEAGATFPGELDRLGQIAALADRGDPLAQTPAMRTTQAAEHPPTLGETWRARAGMSTVQSILDAGFGPRNTVEPGFNPYRHIEETPRLRDDPIVRALVERGQFDGSSNPDRFEWDLLTGRRFFEDAETVHRAGTGNAALTMAGSMIGDPVNLLPFGAALKLARAGTTAARVAKAAGTMAAINLGLEKFHNALQPASDTPGLSNETMAAVSGAGFGAGIGLLTSPAFQGAVGGWLQSRRIGQLRRDLEHVLAEPVARPFDPVAVKSDADLARVTIADELARGKANLERILGDEPVDNRTVSALHRDGDEAAAVLDQLRAKYAAAGKQLVVVDHPDQWVYDLTSEVKAILDHPSLNLAASPGDFAGYGAIDSMVSGLTTRYANLAASVTPGGRLAQSMLGRVADVYRTLSGSATTITKGAALDPLNYESPVAAENLKAVTDGWMEATRLELRKRYVAARREGDSLVYDGKPIGTRFDYSGYQAAVADLLRRENAASLGFEATLPAEVPKAVRDGADLVRGYMGRMAEEGIRTGMLPKGVDAGAYLPRVYNVPEVLAREGEFKAKVADSFARNDLLREGKPITPDERIVIPEVAERLDQTRIGELLRAKRRVTAAEEAGFKAVTRAEIDERAKAVLGDWSGMGSRGRSTRQPIEETLRDIFTGQAAMTNPLARFRAMSAWASRAGHLKGQTLVDLDGRQLAVGDHWWLGEDIAIGVAGIGDDGTLRLRVFDHVESRRLNSIIETDPDEYTFTVPESEPLVATRDTLTKAAEPDLGAPIDAIDETPADGAAMSKPPKRVRLAESDLPADMREAYRALLPGWYRRNAQAAFDTITAPRERHGVVGIGGGENHAAARTLTIDEAALSDFLVKDLEDVLMRYSRTMGGRIAVRRAIQLNDGTWGGVRLSDGSRVEDGAGLLTYLRETVDTLDSFARYADTRSARKVGGSGSLVPFVRRLRTRIERDVGIPLAMLEGRNPLDGNGVFAALQFMGRTAGRISYLNKLGSVAWAQLNDLAPVSMYMMARPSSWAMIPRALFNLKTLPRRDLEAIGVVFDGIARTRSLADVDAMTTNAGIGEGIVRRATAAAERGLEAAGDVQSRVSLIASITNTMKAASGGTAIDRLVNMSKRTLRARELIDGGMSRKAAFAKVGLPGDGYLASWVNRMGLTAGPVESSSAGWFHRMIYDHGLMPDDTPVRETFPTFAEYMAHDGFVKPNFAEWSVDEAGQRFLDKILANLNGEVSRSLVVTPGVFDRPIINQSIWGRLFNQFQSFAYGFGNQRLRLMAQMPARMQLSTWATYLFLGALSDAIASHLSGRRSFDDSIKMWRENPMGGVYAAWGRSGLAGWFDRPVAVADALGVPWSPGNVFGAAASSTSARHVEAGKALTFFGPVAADLDTAMRLSGRLASGQFDRESGRMAAKLTPFQNLLWLRLLHQTTGAPVVPESIVLPKAGAGR